MRRAYAMYALFLCFSRNMKLICPFAPHTADDSMDYVSINKTSVYTVSLCQIYVHSISKCEYSRQEIYLQNIQGKGREIDKM